MKSEQDDNITDKQKTSANNSEKYISTTTGGAMLGAVVATTAGVAVGAVGAIVGGLIGATTSGFLSKISDIFFNNDE
jgi:outer membrane lipoprotein SlyB